MWQFHSVLATLALAINSRRVQEKKNKRRYNVRKRRYLVIELFLLLSLA